MLRTWPVDALVIVASRSSGAEVRKYMDSLYLATCRDCGSAVVFSGHTLGKRRGYRDLHRDPRLIEFLCVKCVAGHDMSTTYIFEDHRCKTTA